MSAQDSPQFLEKAISAWGEDMPAWVRTLATQCDLTSQNAVAKRLQRSAASVSQTLGKTYPGDMSAMRKLVEGAFMSITVECPVFGTYPLDSCQRWRQRTKRATSNSNSQQVQMYRACNQCPLNTKDAA